VQASGAMFPTETCSPIGGASPPILLGRLHRGGARPMTSGCSHAVAGVANAAQVSLTSPWGTMVPMQPQCVSIGTNSAPLGSFVLHGATVRATDATCASPAMFTRRNSAILSGESPQPLQMPSRINSAILSGESPQPLQAPMRRNSMSFSTDASQQTASPALARRRQSVTLPASASQSPMAPAQTAPSKVVGSQVMRSPTALFVPVSASASRAMQAEGQSPCCASSHSSKSSKGLTSSCFFMPYDAGLSSSPHAFMSPGALGAFTGAASFHMPANT